MKTKKQKSFKSLKVVLSPRWLHGIPITFIFTGTLFILGKRGFFIAYIRRYNHTKWHLSTLSHRSYSFTLSQHHTEYSFFLKCPFLSLFSHFPYSDLLFCEWFWLFQTNTLSLTPSVLTSNSIFTFNKYLLILPSNFFFNISPLLDCEFYKGRD